MTVQLPYRRQMSGIMSQIIALVISVSGKDLFARKKQLVVTGGAEESVWQRWVIAETNCWTGQMMSLPDCCRIQDSILFLFFRSTKVMVM